MFLRSYWMTTALTLLSLTLASNTSNDESPGFFLKISKNVPRIGRRSDAVYEKQFRKDSNPMIKDNALTHNEYIAWLNDLPHLNKRLLYNRPSMEQEYSVVQPVNSNTLIELIEKDALQSENIKFVHWKDFDRALQEDKGLYDKVISLGRKPDLGIGNYWTSNGNFYGGENFRNDLNTNEINWNNNFLYNNRI